MSDESLDLLSVIYSAMEVSSLLPKQAAVTVMSLIGKQAGSFRPIGLFSSIYRLWGKGGRGYATRWEEDNRR
eukprot:610349-Pyramimonas_sp.AAC.1